MIGHIEDLCKPTNKDRFTCAGAKVVYNGPCLFSILDPELERTRMV
jgi:hypothetical protein